MMRKKTTTLTLALVLALTVASAGCGGGGGDGTGGVTGGPRFAASFTSDNPSPTPGQVSVIQSAQSNDLLTLEVHVTGIDDVFGASFEVGYDPNVVSFVRFAAGTVLESGGNQPNYTVSSPRQGTVIVGASRIGNVNGVDIGSSQALIRLTFRGDAAGQSTLQLRNGELLDGQLSPQPIVPVDWSGGSISVTQL